MKKMPVLFVGHGNPMNALDKNSPFNQNFRQNDANLWKTQSHFDDFGALVQQPFAGDLRWTPWNDLRFLWFSWRAQPSAISRTRFARIGRKSSVIIGVGIGGDESDARFDHGAWTVLKFLYPDADIPVVQLSLNRLQSAEWHFQLGEKNYLLCENKACWLSAVATLCII